MKTSSTVCTIIMLWGGAEAFSRTLTHTPVTRISGNVPLIQPLIDHSSTTSSQLSATVPVINKQELLNNRHSASDWLYNIRSLPQSGVLREIRNPVLSVFAWACVISVAHRCLVRSNFGWLAALGRRISIPGTAHSYLVSALGLLLVFRTNSAYQRFNVRIWN